MSVFILVAIVLSIPTAKACRNDVPCPSELLIFFVCVVSEDEYCDSPNKVSMTANLSHIPSNKGRNAWSEQVG